MSSAYLTRWSGPMSESDDPYTGQVHPSPTNIYPIKHVQEIIFLPPKGNANYSESVKYALMNNGAIDASMYWNDIYYNSSTASYYYPTSGTSDHNVTIVGWDDNYNSSNFIITPPGNGAFIIKNSWGTSFGVEGYFYISYYDQVFAARAVFAIAEAINNFKDIYQYDPLGFLDGIGYTSTSMWMSNMFTATSNNPIAAVSFYTLVPNTECTIRIYTNCSGTPSSGQLATSKTFTSDIAGYQTVRLDNLVPITSGIKFSIAVQLTVPEGNTSSAAIEYKIAGFSSEVTINPGESFLSLDASYWYDIIAIQDTNIGNICLKAFTSENTPVYTVTYNGNVNTSGTVPVDSNKYVQGATVIVQLTALIKKPLNCIKLIVIRHKKT